MLPIVSKVTKIFLIITFPVKTKSLFMLILKENTEAMQRMNRASDLKVDNLKFKSQTRVIESSRSTEKYTFLSNTNISIYKTQEKYYFSNPKSLGPRTSCHPTLLQSSIIINRFSNINRSIMGHAFLTHTKYCNRINAPKISELKP